MDTYNGGFEKFKSSMLKAAKPLLDTMDQDPISRKTLQEIMVNVLLDTSGPRFLETSVTEAERAFYQLFFGFTEILESVDVFREIPFYIRRFPPKSFGISQTRFIRYHIGNYLNEICILQERLKGYIKVVKRIYRANRQVLSSLENRLPKINSLLQAFEQSVRVRGVHVHQRRYVDRDIDRLILLDVLTSVDKSSSETFYLTGY